MEESNSKEYDDFLIQNTKKVNKYLNIALWFFIITGPAIAFGIKIGFYKNISYGTCFNISVFVFALALIHFIMLRKNPKSILTGMFALTALDALLVYMNYSHVNIYLTWFLVPVLSLLFANKVIYIYSVTLNYVLMFASVWITAPYYASMSSYYEEPLDYFKDIIGGFTIETFILIAATFEIVRLTSDYFKGLFSQYGTIKKHEAAMKEKMDILDSMSEIYDNVNLVDFVDNTEMSLRNSDQKKQGIDMEAQSQTIMNQSLSEHVMPDQLEDFKKFTNIKTVRARLSQKKIISADFIDAVDGWFRAQYITVDSTIDGIPNRVIYTTRNVDEEKRREEHLIRISLTDEMTRLFNRRCYEEDLEKFRQGPLADDFVMFSVDVNGLKKVNDTKGHAAGDELIKGAANCLTLAVGNNGKAYRTGGDEFMAVLFTENPEKIRDEIKNKADNWHGVYTDELTLSVGYAAVSDNKNSTVDELEHIADADMYLEKDKYYKDKGIERRK